MALDAITGWFRIAITLGLQLPPSRMVALVDELEDRGLIERRALAGVRRVRALYLTDDGRTALDDVMRVSGEHEAVS